MPVGDAFVQIELRNFDELAKQLGKSREYVLIAMNEALRKSGDLLTPRIREETPVGASHKLRNSTVYQVLGKSEDMRLEIRQSAFSDSGFPYGVAVRHGTRPHFPPIAALIPWVRAKLAVPENKVRSVAFLIARKISRVGTPPNPYHIRVLESSTPELLEIMTDGVVQFIVRVGDVPEVQI